MRQGANSAVRFTAYSALKQAVQGSAGPSQQLPSTVTFGIGAIAGIITVCEYRTGKHMPRTSILNPPSHQTRPCLWSETASLSSEVMRLMLFCNSVIKTRMQSLEARAQYRNSAHCAYRIFTEEGVTRFWKGTTPRLARLIVSRANMAATELLMNVSLPYHQMSGGIVFTVYEAAYPVMASLV